MASMPIDERGPAIARSAANGSAATAAPTAERLRKLRRSMLMRRLSVDPTFLVGCPLLSASPTRYAHTEFFPGWPLLGPLRTHDLLKRAREDYDFVNSLAPSMGHLL